RRRHTRLQGDWSSDVCSSDLEPFGAADALRPVPPRETFNCVSEFNTPPAVVYTGPLLVRPDKVIVPLEVMPVAPVSAPERLRSRSEERRVGREGRRGGGRYSG